MTAIFDRTKTLILGAAACVLAVLTGCGNHSPAAPQAAKVMYVVNYDRDANNNNLALY